MSVNTIQELTLRLPADLVTRLQQTATRRHQPVEQIVAEILGNSLPPLHHSVAPRMRQQIAHLARLSESELRASANAQLPEPEQARLSELLERNREEVLTTEEGEEIERLLDRVEEVATEKAAATWLQQNRPVRAE